MSEPIIHTGLGGIKVDPPEMINGSDKKWRDAQKFDGWTQRMETYISFNGIDLNTEKALTVVGFRLEEQALVVFVESAHHTTLMHILYHSPMGN